MAQEMLKMREKGRNEWKKWAEKKSGSSSKKHKMSSAKTVISLQQRWMLDTFKAYLLPAAQHAVEATYGTDEAQWSSRYVSTLSLAAGCIGQSSTKPRFPR